MNDNLVFVFRELEDQTYSISADLESPPLYPKYYEFFKEHGYEGNGYCWESHIIQILEKLDDELLDEAEFDPEAGSFVAIFESKKMALKFQKIMEPIFSNLNELNKWVLAADRDRIDD